MEIFNMNIELIDKTKLLKTICNECPSKRYTVGFTNELKCKSICDVTTTINKQSTIKISDNRLRKLRFKNK